MILYSSCPICRKSVTLNAELHLAGQPVCDSCTLPTGATDRLRAELHTAAMQEQWALDHHGDGSEAVRAASAATNRVLSELNQASARAPYTLAASAVAYASNGYPVFPCSAARKTPAVPRSKGGRGVLDATTDTERVKRWWQKHPNHNIGLATGFLFDVVDVDFSTSGAWNHWMELKEVDDFEVDAMVNTPHGLHAYVVPTGDGNTANAETGIDYRGKGGYVLAPPSVVICDKKHREGYECESARYEWWTKPSPRILDRKETDK